MHYLPIRSNCKSYRFLANTSHALISVLLFFTLAGTILSPALAEVYRWTDESGRVHFSDRPHIDQPIEQVKIHKQNNSPSNKQALSDAQRREKQRRLLDIYSQERAAKKTASKNKKREQKKRLSKCAYAKNQLREYREAGNLYEPQPDGKRRILSHEERAAAEISAQDAVEKWCD